MPSATYPSDTEATPTTVAPPMNMSSPGARTPMAFRADTGVHASTIVDCTTICHDQIKYEKNNEKIIYAVHG